MARFLIVTTLVVVAATTLAWFVRPVADQHAFQAPGLIQVVYEDGTGVARDVTLAGGRIGARSRLSLVLRWLLEPVELEVDDPEGYLELQLGDPDAASGELLLNPRLVRLLVRGADGTQTGWKQHREPGGRYAVAYEGGAYRVLRDGVPLGDALPGDPPVGVARVALRPYASLRGLRCRTADGQERSVDAGPLDSTLTRLLWVALSTLLGMFCSRTWWLARGTTPVAGSRAAVVSWGLGLLAVGVLLSGLWTTLLSQNGPRLLEVPEVCSLDVLQEPGPLVVRLGEPWGTHPRRDGDFVLEARVRLAEQSALDVLVRGEPPNRDGGILVTLSADGELPGGVSRNRVLALDTDLAPEGLRELVPDTAHDLRVECRGDTTTVSLNGQPFGRQRSHDIRAGRIALHALRGEASLEGLTVTPLGQPESLAGTLRRWQFGLCGALLAGLVPLVLVCRRRVSGLLWIWPLAAASHAAAPAGSFLPLAGLSALFLLLTPPRGRRVLGWALGAACLGVALWAHAERPADVAPTHLNQVTPADVRGPGLSRAYAWVRHPLIRRFSTFVRDQRFREERLRQPKPKGQTRVFALGSSSTFGYGVGAEQAYPARIQHHLRAAGFDVDVLNAGVPGSMAARLALVLEGTLLQLQPDVILVNLSFNDHLQGALESESEHFARMTSEGIGRGGQLLAHVAAWFQLRAWRRSFLQRAAGKVDPDLTRILSTEPAQRFADELRRMVQTARAAGVALMFVKEPPNPDEDNGLIQPFHEAMAEVGTELDVPVVDLSPVIEPSGGALYIDAVHLSIRGNDLVGAALARELVAAGLVGEAKTSR